jgi:opacity protein-like surface antigen
MKKIILSAVTSACFLIPSASAESAFFVKANIAYSKLNKVKDIKSKNDVAFGVGLGYNYLDNARIDITLDHLVNPKFAGDNQTISGNINTLLFNFFVDVADISIAKIFIGAGGGMGRTEAKISGNQNSTNNGKAKAKYSTAYAMYIGTGIKFAPGTTAELTYSYRYLGETKEFKNENFKFKGQHLSAGIRFDL